MTDRLQILIQLALVLLSEPIGERLGLRQHLVQNALVPNQAV